METTKVKMNERFARRLLASKSCEIFVSYEGSTFKFLTAPGIREGDKVFVPKEEILVPLGDISSISFTDRFGNQSAMEVDWE